MGEDLFAYIQQLEMMAFFSGFPFIYALVSVLAGNKKNKYFPNGFLPYLSIGYGLTAALFAGYIGKGLGKGMSLQDIIAGLQHPWLVAFGLLGLMCWLPFIRRRSIIALLHSLVFFFFILKDLFISQRTASTTDAIKNDMKIYTDSIILNAATFIIILLLHFFLRKMSSAKKH